MKVNKYERYCGFEKIWQKKKIAKMVLKVWVIYWLFFVLILFWYLYEIVFCYIISLLNWFCLYEITASPYSHKSAKIHFLMSASVPSLLILDYNIVLHKKSKNLSLELYKRSYKSHPWIYIHSIIVSYILFYSYTRIVKMRT